MEGSADVANGTFRALDRRGVWMLTYAVFVLKLVALASSSLGISRRCGTTLRGGGDIA